MHLALLYEEQQLLGHSQVCKTSQLDTAKFVLFEKGYFCFSVKLLFSKFGLCQEGNFFFKVSVEISIKVWIVPRR